MKKILRLIIPAWLFVIIIIFLLLNAPVSNAVARNLSTVGDKTRPEQGGPAWYDSAWHYRRPVLIANSGAFLSYYQVLVRLDSYNFDFDRTKPDGSDVRFTHSDGTTVLNYWIESYDSPNQLAYVWVRVPSISSGNTAIYLYYDNPAASPASDGASTFENFDDQWSQFVAGGQIKDAVPQNEHPTDQVYAPFDWSILSGVPTASAGILSLNDSTGIKSTSTYLYNAIGYRAKYSLGSVDEWIGFINGVNGARTMIGDSKPGNIDDLFLIDSVNGLNFENVVLSKGGGGNWHGGYHVYELRWKSGQSTGDVDHGASIASSTIPAYVPGGYLPVTLNNDTLPNGTLQVDWVYVRQFRDPEPSISVQGEQGLVALSIDNTGYPNPLRKLTKLTYQLTIANTSSINAPGVVVTDTLPGNIQIGPVSASQGNCEPGSIILCDLDTIQANSTASITIIVTPTLDGELINTAEVGSPSKELNYSDNTGEQTTLVDSVPPVVNWVKPIADGEIYFTLGGMIRLETTASDNDQVDRVEFWWYDGVSYWPIATETAPPYQADFDSKLLAPGIPYWFEARAYDRAGNSNFPYDRAFIYIIRNNKNFLPLVRR